jgi:hypothetical protein
MRSQTFARIVAKGLGKHFPSIFKHLENARAMEGMQSNDSRIGDSPFSAFAITKNYHVNVHCDALDFSYGFFLWLGGSGKFLNFSFILFNYLLI